jgi:hypothetical protein
MVFGLKPMSIPKMFCRFFSLLHCGYTVKDCEKKCHESYVKETLERQNEVKLIELHLKALYLLAYLEGIMLGWDEKEDGVTNPLEIPE